MRMAAEQRRGLVFYVMGPSGSGKDSLLEALRRHRMDPDLPLVIAHRYITRAAAAGGENHIALTEQEFSLRLARGCFALHWESHGLRYGVGVEIECWLRAGLQVVLNGSRGALPMAKARFPNIVTVLIDVAPEVLRQRLLGRGRESEDAIQARLQRASQFAGTSNCDFRLDNTGPIESTRDAFLCLARQCMGQREETNRPASPAAPTCE